MKFFQYTYAAESAGEDAPVDELASSLGEELEAGNESSELEGNIAEADDIHEALEEMSEHIDSAAEGEGMSPSEAAVLEPAIEHFRKRLGYTSSGVFPSMESFGGKISKKEGAKLVVNLNRKTMRDIQKARGVAQEGLFDNIKYRLGLWFSNRKKISERLDKVSTAYDNKGAKEEKLKKPPFSKFFNRAGLTHVRSGDVYKIAQSYLELVDNKDLVKLVVQATEALEDLVAAVQKPTITVEQERLKEINSLSANVSQLRRAIDKKSDGMGPDMTRKVDYDPLQPGDKAKLVTLVKQGLTNDQIEKAMDQFYQAAYEAHELSRSKLAELLSIFGAAGMIAGAVVQNKHNNKAEVRAAKQGIDAGVKIYYHVMHLLSVKNEVCYGSVAYIAASTK